MSELFRKFVNLFVPESIMEHFDVENLVEEQGVLVIDMVEKDDINHIPKSILRLGNVVKDGYMNTVELQSFPAQGKEVFLRLKRRRWKLKGTSKGYHNTYDFMDSGMKATRVFGSFLKEIGRE